MKTFFIYGDSNTYGFDPHDMWRMRYAEKDIWTFRLQEAVKDSWRIVADGMNGREIPEGGYALEALLKKLELLETVDLFAVMLGTNDILSLWEPDAEEVAEKMRRFLQRIKERIPAENILIIAPAGMRIPEWAEQADAETGMFGRALSEAYERMAKEEGVRFLDAFPWACDLTSDGVHLSEKGHHRFAEGMSSFLSGLKT